MLCVGLNLLAPSHSCDALNSGKFFLVVALAKPIVPIIILDNCFSFTASINSSNEICLNFLNLYYFNLLPSVIFPIIAIISLMKLSEILI